MGTQSQDRAKQLERKKKKETRTKII